MPDLPMRRRRYVVTLTPKDGRDAWSAHARDAHGGEPDLEGCTLCRIFHEYIRQLEIEDDLPHLAAEAQAREEQKRREASLARARTPPTPEEQALIDLDYREARAALVRRQANRLMQVMVGDRGLTSEERRPA